MKAFLAIFAKLLPIIISNISPQIRQLMADFTDKLAIKVKETPNPYDDFLVEMLITVLALDQDKRK